MVPPCFEKSKRSGVRREGSGTTEHLTPPTGTRPPPPSDTRTTDTTGARTPPPSDARPFSTVRSRL